MVCFYFVFSPPFYCIVEPCFYVKIGKIILPFHNSIYQDNNFVKTYFPKGICDVKIYLYLESKIPNFNCYDLKKACKSNLFTSPLLIFYSKNAQIYSCSSLTGHTPPLFL